MESLLLRAGLREEERTSIARFLNGLNMEVRDKVELLPYRDLGPSPTLHKGRATT